MRLDRRFRPFQGQYPSLMHVYWCSCEYLGNRQREFDIMGLCSYLPTIHDAKYRKLEMRSDHYFNAPRSSFWPVPRTVSFINTSRLILLWICLQYLASGPKKWDREKIGTETQTWDVTFLAPARQNRRRPANEFSALEFDLPPPGGDLSTGAPKLNSPDW